MATGIFTHSVAVHTDMLLNTICLYFGFEVIEFGMFMSTCGCSLRMIRRF
jgi:hypothetical protein